MRCLLYSELRVGDKIVDKDGSVDSLITSVRTRGYDYFWLVDGVVVDHPTRRCSHHGVCDESDLVIISDDDSGRTLGHPWYDWISSHS